MPALALHPPPGTRAAPRRVRVWEPVAFAHLRAHRCAVIVTPAFADNEALCHRAPIYRADIEHGPTRVVFALCATHGAEARTWGTVTRLASFQPLLTEAGEG